MFDSAPGNSGLNCKLGFTRLPIDGAFIGGPNILFQKVAMLILFINLEFSILISLFC